MCSGYSTRICARVRYAIGSCTHRVVGSVGSLESRECGSLGWSRRTVNSACQISEDWSSGERSKARNIESTISGVVVAFNFSPSFLEEWSPHNLIGGRFLCKLKNLGASACFEEQLVVYRYDPWLSSDVEPNSHNSRVWVAGTSEEHIGDVCWPLGGGGNSLDEVASTSLTLFWLLVRHIAIRLE